MTAPPTRPFDYKSYVEELSQLIANAESFEKLDRRHDSEAFLEWRSKVINLSTKISRTYVDSEVDFHGRMFQVMAYGNISAQDQLAAFNKDLNAVLITMKGIVEYYQNYGEPEMFAHASRRQKKQDAPASDSDANNQVESAKSAIPPSPDLITLPWIFRHTPLSTWATIISVLIVVFGAGVTLGSSSLFQKIRDDLNTPNQANNTSPPPLSIKK